VADLDIAAEHGDHHRDPDRRADRAGKVEQARAIGAQVRGERGEGRGIQRDEDQPHANPLGKARPGHVRTIRFQRPARHLPKGCAADHEAQRDQQPRIDAFAGENSGQLHRDQCSHPARHHRLDGLDHAVTEQVLQHRREQRHGGEHDHPHDQAEDRGEQEVGIGKQQPVEQWLARGGEMDRGHPQARQR